MSGIKPSIRPARAALDRTAAVAALGLLAAALAGCAQAPAAQADPAARNGSATGAESKTSAFSNNCARPAWPKDALARRSEGTTTVLFLIDTDGSVARSRIQGSSGDAALDEAARAALVKCTFRPAVRDGKPARAWVPVQYVWTLPPAGSPGAPPAAHP